MAERKALTVGTFECLGSELDIKQPERQDLPFWKQGVVKATVMVYRDGSSKLLCPMQKFGKCTKAKPADENASKEYNDCTYKTKFDFYE